MELGLIGLGRMGGNITRRLISGGHRVVIHDTHPDVMEILVNQGAIGADSISHMISELKIPRVIWVMVPAGEATETVINSLGEILSPGDIIIDGGNSYYKDSIRRAEYLKKKKVHFLDVGTSGGIWGLTEGYCLMVGGLPEAYQKAEPIFKILAPAEDKGYGYMGPSGSGHFVKMVHNGIEYGLMEAYAEGFELMQAKKEFNLDLARISELWNHGSVVRSWLLELAANALKQDPKLAGIQSYVEDSGEGRWTVQEALELAVPLPVISESLQSRFRSRQSQPFGARLLAALRYQFGRHEFKKS